MRHLTCASLVFLLVACGGRGREAPAASAASDSGADAQADAQPDAVSDISAPEAVPADATPDACPDAPGLCFAVQPADAEVIVNGETLTPTLTTGGDSYLALGAGIHQIMLRRDGYVTWRAEVSVGEKAERIEVSLEAKAPPAPR